MPTSQKLCYLYPEIKPHQQPSGRLAVIDIGSSMVRLVVYDNGNYPHLFLNHKVWCLLGKHKGKGTFVLEEERMARAESAIEWFLWVCEQSNVSSVLAVASSAVREAQNGMEFVERVKKRHNLHVEIIDGETEARLSAKGALASIPDAEGVVVDLGGGSLDLCESNDGDYVSLPLGVLSLQNLSGNDPFKAEEIMREALSKVDWMKKDGHKDLVAVGSGMRSIANLHMAEMAYPMRILHDYRMDRDEAIEFCTRFMKGEISRKLTGMTREWREVLPYRAAALVALLKETKAQRVRFATFGLREGVLFSQLEHDVMGDDPLITFAEDMAIREGRGVAYAQNLAAWVRGILPNVDNRILKAAALFAEVGWREQVAYRARGTFELVYGGSFVAVGHKDRARLALMAFFRHSDKLHPGMAPRFKGMLSEMELQETKKVGALFNLASLLDPGARGVLSDFHLELKDGEYVLEGPEPFMNMASEAVVKRLKIVNKILLG